MNKQRLLLLSLITLACFTSSAQLSMLKTDTGVLIRDGARNVLQYRTAPENPGEPCTFCNYLHPLYGLGGGILTEDQPADHPHHRGIFWAWHQVLVNGKPIADQWELKNFEQKIVEFEFMKQRAGNVLLKTEVEWLSDRWKKNGYEMPFIREFTEIEVWPASGNLRRIDFKIQLSALEEGVQIGGSDDEKGYGGFSLRLALPDDVRFSGPQGDVQPEITPVNSPGYINISGGFDRSGKQAGLIIIDHPDNPGYPQSWILRSRESMQNAVFPGSKPLDVSTSDPLTLQYTVLVYSGKMNQKKLQKIIDRTEI